MTEAAVRSSDLSAPAVCAGVATLSEKPSDRRGRIRELDGLRAVAISLVISYHYFQRFPQFNPYGDRLIGWAAYGYLGVHLFFIVSGFVIAFTLEGIRGPAMFVRHRFFRLWPTMVACSVITFAVMNAVNTPFSQHAHVGVAGFLPSWTFTATFVWKPFLNVPNYIDGAYWSLFVEVRFYFWALVVTMALGARRLAAAVGGAALVIGPIWLLTANPAVRFYLETLFFVPYLPLFLIGILAHEAYRNRHRRWAFAGMILAFIAAAFMLKNRVEVTAVALFTLTFIVLVLRRSWLSWLAVRPIVWLGSISYSLYLLHQNIGLSAISSLPKGMPDGVYILAVLAVMAAMIGLAWLVFTYVERPAQRFARRIDQALVSA